ncbi:MAG: hypothetical protein ACK481_07460 [Candidatus Melainabacteria bacterium]|jgi:hypothetical protein
MSEKSADSQKKLELAVSVVVAFINASGKASAPDKSEKGEKSTEKSTKSTTEGMISEKQILDLLEKTYNKLHELTPLAERKIGLGN